MHEDTSSSSLDRFVGEIRHELYGPWWTRRRIAAEFRDHLADSAERMQSDGLGRDEAEHLAIERFGSPDVVARSLAHAQGVGIPSTFTRWGGAALAAGAVTLAASRMGQEFSESFGNGLFGEVSFVPRILCAVGILAMYRRVRGNLGIWGRRGFQLIVAGFVVGFGSSFAWFDAGGWAGVAMMGVGVAVYLAATMRTNELPRPPVAAVAAAIAATFLVGVGGTAVGADTGTVASVIGSVGLAAAAGWLGVTLWAEPALRGRSSLLPAGTVITPF